MIHVKWDGTFILPEVNASLDRMYSDPSYDPLFSGIADVRAASFEMNHEQMVEHHDFISGHKGCPFGPWAVVCETPNETALTLLYEKLKPRHPVRVFSTMEAARAWLSHIRPNS